MDKMPREAIVASLIFILYVSSINTLVRGLPTDTPPQEGEIDLGKDKNATTTTPATNDTTTPTPTPTPTLNPNATTSTTANTTTNATSPSTTVITSKSTKSALTTVTAGPDCQCSSFDAGSFVGGMAAALAIVVIGFILMKYCRQRRASSQTTYANF